MFLYEHEGKEIFRKYGVPIPPNGIAYSVEDALSIAKKIGYPVVIKPQILGGRRGKAGAIRFAENDEELTKHANELLSMEIRRERVKRILVEKKVNIVHEYYLSYLMDFYERKPIVMFSTEGGIEIEEVARTKPEAISKRYLSLDYGMTSFIAMEMLNEVGIKGQEARKFVPIFINLWKAFSEGDLLLAEINPLVKTAEGDIIAVDARVIVYDNAEFSEGCIRELKEKRGGKESLEFKAKEKGISLVVLDGNVGVIGNGAGLTMATVDLVKEFGGEPADFLDIGGGAGPERVFEAIRTLTELPNIRVIIMNIFGGITRCDLVAQGIVEALNKLDLRIPLVVRLTGTNEEEGRSILEKAGIHAYTDMIEAVKTAVRLSMEGK